jgi:DNA-binding MarR family transcriptional regulator
MDYQLVKDVMQLLENFESKGSDSRYSEDIKGFKEWIRDGMKGKGQRISEPGWEGKEKGRSPESVINTLIVHMNRYARSYSKSAIYGSDFSTQEEFIYLINLKAFGAMTKMELIRKNIQDKPSGMQIINRLIQQRWVIQQNSKTDKRSKIIQISAKGLKALEHQMDRIRQASRVVTGDLSRDEKMQLIRLLNKLDHFHRKIFSKNIANVELLEKVVNEYLPSKN